MDGKERRYINSGVSILEVAWRLQERVSTPRAPLRPQATFRHFLPIHPCRVGVHEHSTVVCFNGWEGMDTEDRRVLIHPRCCRDTVPSINSYISRSVHAGKSVLTGHHVRIYISLAMPLVRVSMVWSCTRRGLHGVVMYPSRSLWCGLVSGAVSMVWSCIRRDICGVVMYPTRSLWCDPVRE